MKYISPQDAVAGPYWIADKWDVIINRALAVVIALLLAVYPFAAWYL